MKRTANDYDNWNKKKQRLNSLEECPDIQVGEIWWYYVGVNVGNEIGKGQIGDYKRVCLVLKNNLQNGLILIAPLSTKLNFFSA